MDRCGITSTQVLAKLRVTEVDASLVANSADIPQRAPDERRRVRDHLSEHYAALPLEDVGFYLCLGSTERRPVR